MESFLRIQIYVIAFTIVAVIHSTVSQRRQSSNGSPAYPQSYSQLPQQSSECGFQDKDELPDFHAAAPWAAALFYVEGDLFQKQLTSQYLSTAIFISKRLAITSGSKILTQQQTGLQTKLSLYYGHRASGKQTLIRIRKVEPLNPQMRQPLALKVETSPPAARILQTQQGRPDNGKSLGGNTADLYLLHLESEIDVTPFSRHLCINKNVFQDRDQYLGTHTNRNKVSLSGYAAKNETNGQQVVSFSVDREWRVQSWDNDHINVIMREHQVSYGFLPKHFNPGSALTVKLNDQFFLVGILIRSSESHTMFRSLEKFVETIQMREMEYAPKPTVHIPTERPSSPPYDIRNTENDRYREDQPKSSNAEEQFSYLQESEFDESKVHSKPPHISQIKHGNINKNYGESVGSINMNRESSTRTTSRPDYGTSGPSLMTARPEYTPRAPQVHITNPLPIQTVHQNGNGRPSESSHMYQSQNGNGMYPGRKAESHQIYSMYATTTTQRSYQPSHIPPNSRHQDVQNPDMLQQQQYYQPQQQQQQQHHTKCSQPYLEGVEIECLERPRGVSTSDCINNAPANTSIRLSCKPHYVPLNGDKIIEKVCDSSGNWLPRKTFDCKIGCGLVGHSVPYIVGGSKTAPEKWPWHAAIFKKVNQTSYTYICGATLISRSILVTAAHCVQEVGGSINKELYKVIVGAISSDLASNQKDPLTQEFDIKVIKVNDHYDPRTFEADIALVQIVKPVHLTEYVRPVCFPFPTDENKLISSYQLSEGTNGIVVGFGTTSENWSISKNLRVATLPIVSVKNCTSVLERQPTSSQYCAGYTNGTSVCEGDSGGAHIFRDQFSRYFIQGVISHGNRKEAIRGNSRCDHEKYTVFTKVETFAEWVKAAVYDLEIDYNRRRRK